MRSIVRAHADFMSVLEAMYRPEPDESRWAVDILAMIGGVVAASQGQGVWAVAHEDRYENPAFVFGAVSDSSLAHIIEFPQDRTDALAIPRGEAFRSVFYPGRPVETHGELESVLTKETGQVFRAYREVAGARDVLGLFAYPQPGVVVVLWILFDRHLAPSRAERRVLHRAAGHLDSAFRLRCRPDLAVAAVLSPGGKLLDLEDALVGSTQRERLATYVLAIERARLRERRRDADAIDDWQALVEGGYSIVPRDESDGKRYYLLIRNAAITEEHARFTRREIDVLRMAARGFTGKGIGYALGLAPTSVSTALGSAAAKVGLRSRLALVEVAAAMFGARSTGAPVTALTPAEGDVLELLRRGLTNAEIARLRERSSHTVANQIASILRKSGAPSRRGLAAARLP